MQNFPQDYEIRVLWSIHRGLSGIMEDFREGDTVHVYIVSRDNQFTVEAAGFAEDGSLSFAIPPGLPEGIYGLKAVWTHDGSMMFMSEQDEAFSVSEEDDGEDLLYMRSYTMDYSYDVMDDWEAAVFNGHTTVDRSTWLQRQSRTEERLMELAAEVAKKQNILTAGYGIKIEDDIVSVNFSTDLFIIVDSLPTENIDPTKIYLVPSADHEESNLYIEYIYVQGSWEKIGEFKPEIDLTPYLTKAEARQTYQLQEPGKGLSSNDFTDAEKQKLDEQYTREELDEHLDGDFVHRTGDEEIGGKKTFLEDVVSEGNISAKGGVSANGINDIPIEEDSGSVSGGGVWGGITGILEDQSDLKEALDRKADADSVYSRSQVDSKLAGKLSPEQGKEQFGEKFTAQEKASVADSAAKAHVHPNKPVLDLIREEPAPKSSVYTKPQVNQMVTGMVTVEGEQKVTGQKTFSEDLVTEQNVRTGGSVESMSGVSAYGINDIQIEEGDNIPLNGLIRAEVERQMKPHMDHFFTEEEWDILTNGDTDYSRVPQGKIFLYEDEGKEGGAEYDEESGIITLFGAEYDEVTEIITLSGAGYDETNNIIILQ